MIALGANLPFAAGGICVPMMPADTLRAALDSLERAGLPVSAVSRFYATPCFPAGAGPDYVNAAAVLIPAPGMGAEDVMAILHATESRFGRERSTRWGMRTLDLDLIAWGDAVLPDAATHARWRALSPDLQAQAAPDRLILPHPRVQDRAFVLVPLADVAPDWCHPVLGKTVAQLCAMLPEADRAAVRPV